MLEVAIDHPLRTIKPRPGDGSGPRQPRREMYAEAGIEPKLEELLRDPLTEALMRRDGVSVAGLRELICSTRKVLRDRG